MEFQDIPPVGTKVYLPEKYSIAHNVDNFSGGLAEVRATRPAKSKSIGVLVSFVQEPEHWYSWEFVKRNQERWELYYRGKTYSRIAKLEPA